MLKSGGTAPRIAKTRTPVVTDGGHVDTAGTGTAELDGPSDRASAEGFAASTEQGGHKPPLRRAERRVRKALAPEVLVDLVEDLRRLPRDTDWLEFKVDVADPTEIGEYISALANTVALSGRAFAYVVWGINEGTHLPVGTSFSPEAARVNHEELETWLLRHLTPKIEFAFYEVEVRARPMVVLQIAPAFTQPAQFQGEAFIRVGANKQRLRNFPEREQALLRIFDRPLFERAIAADRRTGEDVLGLLDHAAYFERLGLETPESTEGILNALAGDSLILKGDDAHTWGITNLGAVLFARRLADFPSLQAKAVRVIAYAGDGRGKARDEVECASGYAVGFEQLISDVAVRLPASESIVADASSPGGPAYSISAIRELIANALIHQDFAAPDAGPLIEIFKERIEITNPGTSLVEIDRLLDAAPQSRNEGLATFMVRLGGLAERGRGIDKVVSDTELNQRPAPWFEIRGDRTRAVLLGPRTLSKMDKADRVRACYLHACLRHVNRDVMNIASVRERFAVKAENSVAATRYVNEALEAKVIRLAEAGAAQKLRRYVPYWA